MKFETLFFAKGLLCLFICVIHTTAIWGQNSDFQYKKDSLLKVIASTQGEEKLKAYNKLAYLQVSGEDFDLVLQYMNDFIREARKQQNKEYEILAYKTQLVQLWNYLRYDEFERKANEYLPFFKKNGANIFYYEFYSLLIRRSAMDGNNKRAIEEAKRMYEEARQEDYLYGIAQSVRLMARIYLDEKRYEEAEKYYKETIKYAQQLVKKEPEQTFNYNLASSGYDGLFCTLYSQGKIEESLSLMPTWKKHTNAFKETFGREDKCLVDYYKAYAHILIKKEKYNEAELYCDSIELIGILLIDLNYLWDIKTSIYEGRKEYDKAIDWIDKSIDRCINQGDFSYSVDLLKQKASILNKMGRTGEAYSVFKMASERNDSLRLLENNAQLDEIRTQYEVDKHIVEKEHLRSNLFFAIGACILLAILLGVWMRYSGQIVKKNRTLAQQIKELTEKQEEQINEMLAKTSFSPHSLNETISVADNDLCVESRMDKLCNAIRDLLFKEKIYRDSALTQELMVEKAGTNIKLFSEAFEYCFKMQFKDYINFLRLKDAVYLLEQSDLSIEEISEKAGFGTVRTFRRQFIAKYNITPKDYRNSIKTSDSLPITTG